MAMRDAIRTAILEGGATKESLLELTGTTEKSLASQFTYLRMMGTCPMKQEDGTFKIVSAEEWDAHRSSGAGTAGKILTPAEHVEKAEKRSKRAASAFDNAKIRYLADENIRLNELKFVKAEAELEIAEIELGKAESALGDVTTDEAPPEELDESGADEMMPDDVEDRDLDELQ